MRECAKPVFFSVESFKHTMYCDLSSFSQKTLKLKKYKSNMPR